VSNPSQLGEDDDDLDSLEPNRNAYLQQSRPSTASHQGSTQLQQRLNQVKNVFSALKKHLDDNGSNPNYQQPELDEEEELYASV
jgi:hypothetical protein